MRRLDAHLHFWRFDAARDAWITPAMGAIQRDFLPADAAPVLRAHGVAGCVAVQAHPSEAETEFLLGLAAAHAFIRGVVGWVDLEAADAAARLAHYAPCAPLKGVRAMLQGDADRARARRPAFRRGLAALGAHGLACDLLILPDQLGYAAELAAALPHQRFVVDHLAKPPVGTGALEPWRRDLRALAAHANVYGKVSGLVTETDWPRGQAADFRPYLDAAWAAFGPARLMFGADWPVCNVAGGYAGALAAVAGYVGRLSASEQASFWSGTATAFYRLPPAD